MLGFVWNLLFCHSDTEHQASSTQRATHSLETTEEKKGRVTQVPQGRESLFVAGRPTQIPNAPALPMQCWFFHLGSSPVLTVPLFLTPSAGQVSTDLRFRRSSQEDYSSNGQHPLGEGTSDGNQRKIDPMLAWPKPLDALTSPLHLELPGVCLPGVFPSLPHSLHLHRHGALSWAEPALRELLPQGWAAAEPGASVLLLQAAQKYLQSPGRSRGDTTPRTMRAVLVVAALSGALGTPTSQIPAPIPGKVTELGLWLCYSSCNNIRVAGGVWIGQIMREERSDVAGG